MIKTTKNGQNSPLTLRQVNYQRLTDPRRALQDMRRSWKDWEGFAMFVYLGSLFDLQVYEQGQKRRWPRGLREEEEGEEVS